MIRRPPRSTLFPYTRSSDLEDLAGQSACVIGTRQVFAQNGNQTRFGTISDHLDGDRKSTRLNSSHSQISYAVFCLKKKKPSGLTPSHRANRGSTPKLMAALH